MPIPQSFMSTEDAELAQAFRAILGRKITRRRKDTRWSQEALANESGWSRQQLSRVENGISSIGADRLVALALVLETEITELMPTMEEIKREVDLHRT